MTDTVSSMRSAVLALAVVVSACSLSSTGDPTTTSSIVIVPTLVAPTDPTTTPTADPPLEICDAADSFPAVLPDRVVAGVPDTSSVAFDEFTLIEGAFTAMQFDETGAVALVMIRGALSPRQFTGESQVVEILDGIPALVGPIGDGYWAAAWALPPGDRCDLYSLIFYPPTTPEEALAATGSLR